MSEPTAAPEAAPPPHGYDALAPLVEDRSGRRWWWIVGGVVVLVAAAVVGAFVVFGGDDAPPKPVALPEAFGAYARSHDATAIQIENGIASAIKQRKNGGRLMKSAAVGAYVRKGGTTVAVVVFVVPSSVGSGNAEDVTRELLGSSDHNVGYEPSGPHGGTSRCINATVTGRSLPACSWRDGDTTGVLLSFDGLYGGTVPTPHQLSAVSLAFRDAVD